MNILIDGQTLQSPEVNRGIGVYFRNVLNNMVKQSFIHNWYIAVESKDCLLALDSWVAGRLIPVEDRRFAPGSDYERTTAYTDALERVVEENRIDVYWNPNPLMVNVLFPDRVLKCRMYCMLHDIIPAIMPVPEWSEAVRAEYKRRLQFLKDERIELLCNSQATKNDFERHICHKAGFHVTLLAADSRRFFRRRTTPGIHAQPSVVFVGGFDYRKNIDGAVQAFARACRKYRGNSLIDRAVFKIVCSASEEKKRQFYSDIENLGLRGRIELTGYVSDQKLADILYGCDLFFFPSLYEGFGLPIVEAMLSGAFVLSASNSSLPEVCGGHAILCDEKNVEDMADKIMASLEKVERESVADKERRQRYALGFSWQKTAMETLRVFENEKVEDSENRAGIIGAAKKKIAIMTPWPMQESGIANYVYKLMPYWAEYFDIDIFVDNSEVSDKDFLPNPYGKLYMIDELEKRHSDYDELVYQIGNSGQYHSAIYESLKKYSGVAEIHDYILQPFFYYGYFLKEKKDIYRRALIDGYGSAGKRKYSEIERTGMEPNGEEFPMTHAVAAVSKQVVFHNHWSKGQMPNVPVRVIPLACFDKEDIPQSEQMRVTAEIKSEYGLRDSDLILSCFGFVNHNKRPEVVLRAVKKLRERGYPVKLIFWGDGSISGVKSLISQLNLDDMAHVTGYIDRVKYEAGLQLSDIVVNLRYPSMGEASATLCEAYKFGKPVIVTDTNQYREFPDEVCWKIPIDAGEVESLTEMIAYLIDHPKVRAALGQNAQAYAEQVLSPAKIAKQYKEILE